MLEIELKKRAYELLASRQVECVIGYERASDGINARPCFIYTPEETERLIFDQTCVHNLVKYLLEKRDKRTAVVAKPCDSRAINLLLKEHQLVRERVYIIGVSCDGVVMVKWGTKGTTLAPWCEYCAQTEPVVYDILLGKPARERKRFDYEKELKAIERMSAEERRKFWEGYFARCLRCYACRQVCPGCYCQYCFVDSLEPLWVGIKIDTDKNWLWNMGRAIHFAGRCVECWECQRVCVLNIPLMLLNLKLAQGSSDKFNFETGLSPDIPFPLATYQRGHVL